jgi:glucose-1-phosphate thymidylyltransferase
MADHDSMPLIGIIPAGGLSRRLGPIPCSKEILPVGFHGDPRSGSQPRVVSSYLLAAMREAGVTRAYMVLRPGKWDIPQYYGDGRDVGIDLAYLVAAVPHGPAYTVDQARPFVADARVAFGFPDILLSPDDSLRQVAEHQATTGADLVLGLFPAPHPPDDEMVELDGSRVARILFWPDETELVYTWNAAVWTPVFTEFLHQHLETVELGVAAGAERREVKVGHVFQAAIDAGIPVETVTFRDGRCIDIGTPADLARASGALARGESPFHPPSED